jgi:hypothetical protein
LRSLELELASLVLDEKAASLRTSSLKKYREWRDAALFTYGMGHAKGLSMRYSTEESSDYDFVVGWTGEDQAYFCPVQLKELPPAVLNARLGLGELVASTFAKYPSPTETVLAIKLSRKPEEDLNSVRYPESPFREVYLFWASAPGSARWILYGDLKGNPIAVEFDYPT